jgi:hypothetical protein
MVKPTADPAANTVFDHNTFSAVNGSTFGTNGTSSPPALDALMEKVPMKEWISLMGASAT